MLVEEYDKIAVGLTGLAVPAERSVTATFRAIKTLS